ncbi:MAG: AAA family ATPase [Kofleriaceae bacterium]
MQLARSLGFSMDGALAAVASSEGVHLVDLGGKRDTALIALPSIVDVAAVGAELWVAAGAPAVLHRIGKAGTVHASQPLGGTAGVLRPCAVGAPGALWASASPALIPATGDSTHIALDHDLIIPVTTSRWLVCRRERVQLRDPGTERWSAAAGSVTSRFVDGAVLFGGRTVALVSAYGDTLTQLIVLGLHDAGLHHRITLSNIDLIRFAPARGYALMRSAPDTLTLLDLRFGRVIADYRADRPVRDVAIDDAGLSVVMRFGDGPDDVSVVSVRDMIASPAIAETSIADESASSTEPVAAEPIEPAPPPVGFHRGTRALPVARLLAPYSQLGPPKLDDALTILENYRDVVVGHTSLAIAHAWNEGRLSLPSDGVGVLPFKIEVDGLVGKSTGLAIDDVAGAEQHVRRATATVRAAELSMPNVSTLSALGVRFGLSPLAQLTLLVVAAPALWGELARLYGILANDTGRPLVDELLVSQILAPHATHYAIAAELDRDAALLRHGLVVAGPGRQRPFVSLSCDPIVLRLLRAASAEADLEHVRIAGAERSFDDLLIPAQVKDDIATRLGQAMPSGRGRVVVRGRAGAGRHALLAVIAQTAGRKLGVVDATPMLRSKRLDELRAGIRRAHLLGLLPCVDGLDAIPSDDPAVRDGVRMILDEHPGPLAVRLPSDGEPPLAPGYLRIDLPALSMEQRTACWRILLDEHGLHVRDPGELADRFRVGPGVIAKACVAVAVETEAQSNGHPIDRGLALETAVRQHLESKLRATATRVERLASWSRVILPPDIQESVLELIARIKHRRTVYDTWGMGDVLSTARGVTALFQGGPGTGKTLVASAIANELGMDLYRVDLSRIMSKWIGETEQNLARLFDAAEDGHAIVLFDEADSLFAKRTEVRSSVDRYANLEVNYLLQRLDTFEGIAILTTNFGTAIDSAFKRRLSFRLTFPFPDEDARESLWRSHLPPGVPRSGAFDFADLARRYQLSGGYIRNAAVRAAFLAAEEHSPLTQDHLERAIKAEFREIGKIAESGVLE